jgi:hypothetical protein
VICFCGCYHWCQDLQSAYFFEPARPTSSHTLVCIKNLPTWPIILLVVVCHCDWPNYQLECWWLQTKYQIPDQFLIALNSSPNKVTSRPGQWQQVPSFPLNVPHTTMNLCSNDLAYHHLYQQLCSEIMAVL